MTLQVTISNPRSPGRCTTIDATVDVNHPIAILPRALVEELGLSDSYATFRREGHSSIASFSVSEDANGAVLGLSTLMGLLLEVDRGTGQLRPFEPLLLLASPLLTPVT
ncbi:MAG: hypothetical protein Q7T33_05715 [Dehalococcoidia bacterium]|nr:hypothetical protein [Dehalococcoidia bacterium]